MARLIDANNLTRWLQMVLANENPLDRKARAAFSEALARVNTMPVVDAVPVVHGRWEFDAFTAKYGNPFRCSICKEEYDNTHNFCPNCGAKMDAEE